MAEKTVTQIINPKTGEETWEAGGFKGVGCKAALDAFTKVNKDTKETLKPEYHEGAGGGTVSVGG